MGTIVRQSGKYKAVVRRKGHRHIYEIFDKLSDARSFINKVFSGISQNQPISNFNFYFFFAITLIPPSFCEEKYLSTML